MKKRILTMLVLLMTAVTGAWAESKPIGLNVEYEVGDEITSTTDVYVYYGEQAGTLKKMGVKITSTQPLTISMIFDDSFEFNGDDAVYYLPDGVATGGSAGAIPCVGESTGDATVVHVASGSGTLADPYVFAPGSASSTTAGYSVSLKEGTEDAAKWTINPNPAAEGQTVTATYSGTRRVKSVKAVKVEVIPVGAIKGKFTINNTGKQVYFAKGNLQAVCTSADNNPSSPETFTWQFAENQWDCVGNNAANNSIDGNGSVSAAGTVDLFGWSTAATTYGIHNSTTASDYSGDFVDWGGLIGTGWRTLTKDEWNYLFMTRESGSKVNGMSPSPDNARYTHATINTDNGTGGIRGMILFPDGVTVNYSDATSWGGINQYSNWNGSTKCTTSQWNALAAKGFVFLPTGGVRNGTKISNSNNNGYYWSSYTASSTNGYAHYTRVVASTEPTTDYDSRKIGISVRLVREVATSDEPAANIVDLSKLTENTELKDGDVVKGTLAGNYKISIADGATVTLDGVTINGVNDINYEWAGITCLGDATIILSGTNTVTGFYSNYPGIQAAAGKTLIINGTGSLTASSYGKGAGIGGANNVACGNIEIQGGTITATSDAYGAGIGAGDRADCGNITISGGTVNATGGEYGAGIGGGRRGPGNGSCGNILISGGTVTATGGDKAAGIGGGRGYNAKTFSSCGTITITTGVTKVTATMGDGADNSIGAGYWGTCGTVTIGGEEGAITTSPYTYEPSN